MATHGKRPGIALNQSSDFSEACLKGESLGPDTALSFALMMFQGANPVWGVTAMMAAPPVMHLHRQFPVC
jgi:hypothetical protein